MREKQHGHSPVKVSLHNNVWQCVVDISYVLQPILECISVVCAQNITSLTHLQDRNALFLFLSYLELIDLQP